mmetsp:Transcript_29360/g.28231  ORF Transcript_29360/g.28231 Transcript_29360/m.28231 type:complete len:206 (-) Transcript_29360:1915-2532(-)
MVTTAAIAKRKVKRKKERISKHILASREKTEEEQPSPDNNDEKPKVTAVQKKKQPVKDPAEATAYIMAWKHNRKEGGWKFNTNNQAWLIRHMYEPEQVTKTAFSILMEYFVDLKGKKPRARVIADATRRALRYKKWDGEQKGTEGDSAAPKKDEESKDTTEDDNDGQQQEGDENQDATLWSALSDADKRKEYKRARKVLETVKAQ